MWANPLEFMAAKTAALTIACLTSGVFVGAVLLILARVIDNEKLEKWGDAVGGLISFFGISKFGKSAWEKIEDFLENGVSVFLGAIKKRLDADDADPPK